MATSPTKRTLDLLKKLGYPAGLAEHWNQFARIRQDLLGYIDIVAIIPNAAILAVQATDGTSVSKRIEKIRNNENAKVWSRAGGRIWVIGWRKVGPRGKVKKWEPRIVQMVSLAWGWDEKEIEVKP